MSKLKSLAYIILGAILVFTVGLSSSSMDIIDSSPEDFMDVSWVPTDSEGGSGDSNQDSFDMPIPGEDDANLNFRETMGEARDQIETSMENMGRGGEGGGRSWIDFLKQLLLYFAISALAFIITVLSGRRYKKPLVEKLSNIRIREKPVELNVDNVIELSWVDLLKSEGIYDTSLSTEEIKHQMDVTNNEEEVDQLTKLFVKSKYSDETIREKEKQKAIDLSNKIISN